MAQFNGRYAPSPTGELHLGNLRTALVAWLQARSTGSKFVIRIDDLDRGRSREKFVSQQLRDLEAIGLDWEDEPLRQSERHDAYRLAVDHLQQADRVYPCWCTRAEIQEAASAPHSDQPAGAYPGTCSTLDRAGRDERQSRAGGRAPALRVRAACAMHTVDDALHGEITAQVDDFVLMRGDGEYAYNLAVVLDDGFQGVNQVVRGEDLLSSAPRQSWLAAALGLAPVSYAHVPLVLGPSGQRLAKRDGAVTLADRVALGESIDQVRSMLAASLGLCEPGDSPSPQDLLARFELSKLRGCPATAWAAMIN